MTPAEVLREAARLMRERAQAAHGGPWRAYHFKAEPEWDCWEVEANNEFGFSGLISSCSVQPDAEHIASWHPGVALAVADWLTFAADQSEYDGGDNLANHLHALAVARAFLGALALHDDSFGTGLCDECDLAYPCPTVRALDDGDA